MKITIGRNPDYSRILALSVRLGHGFRNTPTSRHLLPVSYVGMMRIAAMVEELL